METKSEAVKAQELERIESWIKKILKDDWDKYDFRAKYDSSLSYDENKTAIREDLKLLYDSKSLKEKAMEAQAYQERMDTEKIQAAEKEAAEYNKNVVFRENKTIDNYYSAIIRGVYKLSKGFSNLLFIKGRGGIGKSYQIRKALVTCKADFVEVCGEVTEAYLYRLIYENNGKILWFKDVVKLLQNVGSMNLLKSATETEDQRILTKNNYSKQQDDLPAQFVCRCKFIFDYNNLYGTQLRGDFEALATRGDYKELPMSDEDVKNILRQIAKGDVRKEEVTEAIIQEYEKKGMIKLNLRTQWKAMKTREYCEANGLDWRIELADELSNLSKTRVMLYTLIGSKVIKTADLKRLLLKNDIAQTIRTADRMVADWLFLDELHAWSAEEKNFLVCINPKQ